MIFRQAIRTRYLSPTNFKGSRIKAECSAKAKVYDWNYNLDPHENHHQAALKLLIDLDWTEFSLLGGSLKDGSYCFVLVKRGKNEK